MAWKEKEFHAERKGITWLSNNDPQSAEYIHEYMSGSSAAQPAGRKRSYRLAFYNIGWDQASKKHSSQRLAEEVLVIIRTKGVDAMGICEVFNLKDDHLHKVRQETMPRLLLVINGSAEQLAWDAWSDGHW